ncbi:MAG: hypothetical protein K2K68_08720 [Duncaniella sp.]|nr:hypothetical protein [Duncaniella sp.]
MMKRYMCAILRTFMVVVMLAVAIGASAHYKIFAVKGDVSLKHGRETGKAVVDAQVLPADVIIVGQDASVELLDTRDSKTYKVSKPGQYSPSSIVFEARRQSVETTSAVNRNLRIGKSGNPDKQVVYLAKGKVTRALQNYDPHSDTLQIDNKMLGHYVKSMIAKAGALESQKFPVPVKSERTPDGGMKLRIANNIQFPLYFNVLRINPDGTVSLAEIGQPVGSYVLLPNQELMRSQSRDIDEDNRYLVLMAHYYFEVDQLLEAINDSTEPAAAPSGDLPVYLYPF